MIWLLSQGEVLRGVGAISENSEVEIEKGQGIGEKVEVEREDMAAVSRRQHRAAYDDGAEAEYTLSGCGADHILRHLAGTLRMQNG